MKGGPAWARTRLQHWSERIRTELVLFYPNPTRKYLTLSENTRKSTISALTQRALSLNIMRFSFEIIVENIIECKV